MLVLDAYRGRGVGSKLVEQFCTWCADQGITQITVDALATNEEALEFYRRLGFGNYLLTLERTMEN
ncbi:GNAT family N-acetyltransferase [Chloroflexi bacterium TSY]|nr:GNAT family N-acetyltransferase [Chloroflexi bacterium TSY]